MNTAKSMTADGDRSPAAPDHSVLPGESAPRGRSWTKRIVIMVCVALALVVGIGGELVVRDRIRTAVLDKAEQALHTPEIVVDMGSAPMLIGLAMGRIPQLSIAATGVRLCQLSGVDISAVLHGVSLLTDMTVTRTDVVVSLGPTAIARAFANASGMDAETLSVTSAAGAIRVQAGRSGMIVVEVVPEIDGSDLVFTTRSLVVNGQPIDVSKGLPLDTGADHRRSLAGLPLDLTARSVTVTNSGLVLAFSGGSARLAVDPSGTQCGAR